MTLKAFDRVKETSTTSGTGNITLLGAPGGYQTFASAFSVNDTFNYCITDGTNWEVGKGTLVDSTTVSRDTVRDSSNNGELVDFDASGKEIFNVNPAEDVNPDGLALFIQDTQPDVDETKYMWIQTNYIETGDFTVWFEDGT